MTTTKRPRNSFSAALDAAGKRYAQATKEREKAVQTLDKLDKEIPSLRETIAALQKQLGKKGVMPNEPSPPTYEQGKIIQAVTGEHRAETSAGIPPEVLKHIPQDLTGFGSIPPIAAPAVPLAITSEDDTLPDPEGTPLTEE